MDERLLNNLITRLDRIEQRLTELERNSPTPHRASSRPTPPPFVLREKPASTTQPLEEPIKKTPVANPKANAVPPQSNAGSEYLIGAKILPWSGAILLIICITSFVTLAYRQGFITKEHIFGLATVICMGFIAVGQKLRDEKEQFGHLLTGLGSAGLYITFAAGQFVQNIYSSTVMLGLFVILTLINLAYSYWRKSSAFLIIGATGGFISALLPLYQGDIGSNLILATLTTVPAALIISRHRWTVLSYFVIPVTVFIVSFGLFEPGFEWQKVGVLVLTAILGSYATASAWLDKKTYQDQGFYLAACLAGIAWITFEVIDGPMGSLHIIGYGLSLAAISRFTPKNIITTRIQQAAVFIPFVVAPWGATKPQAVFILSSLAIGASILSIRTQPRTISVLSGILSILAVTAYLVTLIQTKVESEPHHLTLLATIFVGVIAATWTLVRNYPQNKDQIYFIAGFTNAIVLTAFLAIASGMTKALPAFDGIIITITLVAVIAHFLSKILDSYALKVVGSAWSFLLTGVIFSPWVSGESLSTGLTIHLNGVVLAHWFVLYRLYITKENKTPDTEIVSILVPAALVTWDTVRQLFQLPLAGLDIFDSGLFALLITLILLASFARRTNQVTISSLSLFFGQTALVVGFFSRVPFAPRPIATELLLVGLSIGLSSILTTVWSFRKKNGDSFQSSALASFQVSFFALYGGFILMTNEPLSWSSHRSLIVTGAVIMVALIGSHFFKNRTYHLISAWCIWLTIALTAYFNALLSIPAVGIILILQILLAFAGDKLVNPPASHRALHCLLGAIIATQLGTLIFTHPIINLPIGPSVTTTWAVLATVALVSGFSARITELRHTGLVLLFLAGAKVIFFDLASTSELVRVGVTFILGLAMIGGGYLYIRLQNRLDPPLDKAEGQPSQ